MAPGDGVEAFCFHDLPALPKPLNYSGLAALTPGRLCRRRAWQPLALASGPYVGRMHGPSLRRTRHRRQYAPIPGVNTDA